MNIQRLRVNHIVNPLGFDLGDPTFSWEVTGALGTRAEASRIIVTSAGGVLADTGWADLDNACATVEGLAERLAPRTRYEWRVLVRTDAGKEAASDPAFASELMGKTVAVWPSDGNVFAPVSGTVVSMMPHAFGIAGDDGCEVLVHVGIDTVSMNGDGFTLWSAQGDHVSAGQPMLTFDRNKVAAGYKDIVMTIVTNSDDYAGLSKLADGRVSAGAQLMRTA